MSHSVTITRTTTTSNSTLVLNTGYLKTVPGLLKLLQLILGAICVGILAWYFTQYRQQTGELFFLLMTVTFLIGTFCLLLSCVISLSTGGIISKTIYELIYHSVAFVLYLAAAITFLISVIDRRYHNNLYSQFLAAAILGLVNSILYLFSAIFAQRSYRGI